MNQERRLNILLHELLENHEPMTIKELSLRLNVSYKTVQNDLVQLKRELSTKGAHIESKRSIGIHLIIDDEDRFNSFLKSVVTQREDVNRDENFEIQLTYFLLTTKNYIKIDELTDIYYFSRAKISSVLNKINKSFMKYHLEIVSKPFYGMKIEGKERDRRRYIQSIYSSYISNEQLNQYEKLLAMNQIKQILKRHELSMSSTSLDSIRIYMVIAMYRMQKNCYIGMDVAELSYCCEMKEFAAASELAKLMEDKNHDPVPIDEIAYLTQLLSGNQKYSQDKYQKFEESIHFDLDRLIKKIFHRINDLFAKDFSKDFELYISLGLHMIPLISRIRFNFGIKNPYVSDIKKTYPLAYEIAVEAAMVLEEEFDMGLDEDEIGYLALHFNLALEREKLQIINLKKILIICSTGGGMANLLAFKVSSNFAKYISKIDTADLHEVSEKNLDEYDYVLTTVPLPYELQKPVLQISHMLSSNDIGNINSFFVAQKESWGLIDILSPEDFMTDIKGESKQEIINAIVLRLKLNHQLQEDFYEQTLRREALFSTEIDNKIAFPHPLVQETNETFMSVTILNKPVFWTHDYVQVILIGNVKKGDGAKAQRMYEEFAKLVSSKESILTLIKNPTYQTLVNEIEKQGEH